MPIFFALGMFALGFFAGRRGRADGPPQLALSSGSVGDPVGYAAARAAGLPGPITMLVGFMKQDRVPPAVVVQHAIAEAKQIGRHDLARDITKTFGDPRSRVIDVPPAPQVSQPSPAPQAQMPASYADPRDARQHDYERERDRDRRWDRERDRERERDYQRERGERRFEHRLEREIEIDRDIIAAQARAAQAAQFAQAAPGVDPWTALDPELAQQMRDAGMYGGAPQTQAPLPSDDLQDAANGGSPDVQDADASVSGSPLPGISPQAWNTYRNALVREAPTFDSARHVGRYRQHKDRLRELGCDPAMLVSHPRAAELQEAALAMDAIDSAKHLAQSGTVEHVGKAITLPGEAAPRVITLSGLLGIAQVAGLEGAANWLENREDRKNFRHTTAGFVATNGVF